MNYVLNEYGVTRKHIHKLYLIKSGKDPQMVMNVVHLLKFPRQEISVKFNKVQHVTTIK